jgi:hypothetical protein
MRNLDHLKKYQHRHAMFELFYFIPSPLKKSKGARLAVIATTEHGWDHVSVSLPNRCPTWSEMDFIKRLFFKNNEVAFQLHPATSNHINVHNFCLHIWRPQDVDIPLPPTYMV